MKMIYGTGFALMFLTGVASAASLERSTSELSDIKNQLSSAETLGSGMAKGLKTYFPVGDGKKAGLFTIIFQLPPKTIVQAHSHPDDRSCFVLQGTWFIGYGDRYSEKALRKLTVGGHYTEPAGSNHFAATGDEEVIVECTGLGPTGTTFVEKK